MLQKGGAFLLESTRPEEVFTPEDLTGEHRLIAQTVNDFVEKEIIPREADLEAQKDGVMRSLLKKTGELGLLSADIP